MLFELVILLHYFVYNASVLLHSIVNFFLVVFPIDSGFLQGPHEHFEIIIVLCDERFCLIVDEVSHSVGFFFKAFLQVLLVGNDVFLQFELFLICFFKFLISLLL